MKVKARHIQGFRCSGGGKCIQTPQDALNQCFLNFGTFPFLKKLIQTFVYE